ncbi:MAG TPA: hypothetical protein VNC61_07335 [Acidimicrobiales bacterium]|nr:hypothetical protein [Acidimicrobiales bacterium]
MDHRGRHPRSPQCLRITKTAAEDLCQLVHRDHDLPSAIGFGRYIVCATTPFGPHVRAELVHDAPRRRASAPS